MPKFKIEVRDETGRKIHQTMEGSNRQEVLSQLRRENMTVLSVTQEAEGRKGGLLARLMEQKAPKPKIKLKDLVIFTRQFSTMISAGIPVLECMEILTEQAEDPGFKNSLLEIISDVSGGSDLSQAMGKHPIVFEKIYVNMIKAGEASGQLDTILQRLAEYQEAADKLRGDIQSAMTYPIISLVMITGITLFLMVGIIPKFKSIFGGMGVQLPLPTVIVMGISDIMRVYWLPCFAGLAGVFFLLRWYKTTNQGELLFDKLILKAPVFGTLFQMVAISRFARTFSCLIQSGVPILGALEIVESTAGNRVIEIAIASARDSIRAGETLAAPLGKSAVFPPMVVRMIAVGERSGALEQLLEKISEFYEQQVSKMVESLTSLIEPLMIGVMGGMVGSIVLAIFLPIFKMQEAMGN